MKKIEKADSVNNQSPIVGGSSTEEQWEQAFPIDLTSLKVGSEAEQKVVLSNLSSFVEVSTKS